MPLKFSLILTQTFDKPKENIIYTKKKTYFFKVLKKVCECLKDIKTTGVY